MSTPLMSIGGLASGLDTTDIVQQLMALERQPIVKIQQRQTSLRQANEAWGGIVTRLSSLRGAVDALKDPAALGNTTRATSSNEAVAAVTRTGTAQPGSVSFSVDLLATNHQVAVGGTFTSTTQVLGEGTITLALHDGTSIEVELGEGATLQDAARALNRQAGISASVLRTGDDAFRLIISSDTTGSAAGFGVSSTVAGLDHNQITTLAEGLDAQLRMGTGDNALTITRASNTISDLVGGVEVRLTGLGDVTVGVQQDVDSAAKLVTNLVDQLNGVLTHLATVSRTSAEAGERGVLAGDAQVRSLQLELRGALSRVVGDGTFQTLNQIGVELTRDGKVTLDQGKLREALTTDPQAVGNLLGRVGQASDDRVTVTAIGRAQAGEYEVRLDVASRVAAATGATVVPPSGEPKTYSIKVNGKVISVQAETGDDAASVVRKLNTQLALENIAVRASVGSETETEVTFGFEATRAGASGNFTVVDPTTEELDDLGIAGDRDTFGFATEVVTAETEQAGRDAAATVTRGTDVWNVTGGSVMVLPEGAGRGLTFTVPAGVPDGLDLGTITVADGLAGVLDRVLQHAEGRDGSIARSREAIDGRIRAADDSIKAFEQRLELRERTLRRQFTAMESAMAQFSAQANWLASQLSSMMQ